MTAKPLVLALAIVSALAPVESFHRPQQRKVGSTNPNRAAQKRQRNARKKGRR